MLYIMCMTRFQIYLPENLLFEYQMLAKWQNVPMAHVIRKALNDGVKKTKKQTAAQAFKELANIAFKGPGDLSTRHDEYLYGGN